MKVQIQDKTRLKSFKKKFKITQSEAVKLAGQYLVSQVKINSSYSPLPKVTGVHPYAVGGRGSASGRPWWGVAKQDGLFIKSIRGYLRHKRKGPTYTVDYGNKAAKHVAYVTQGTKVMIARDVILHTYNQKTIQKEMSTIIEKTLRKGIRHG